MFGGFNERRASKQSLIWGKPQWGLLGNHADVCRVVPVGGKVGGRDECEIRLNDGIAAIGSRQVLAGKFSCFMRKPLWDLLAVVIMKGVVHRCIFYWYLEKVYFASVGQG